MNQYPCWKYHPGKEAVIVNDPAEEAALGAGWGDSPAGPFSQPQLPFEPQAPQPAAPPVKRGRGRPRKVKNDSPKPD